VTRLVRSRFGETPGDLESRLADLDEVALDALIDRVLQVASADELLAGL
jgi:hypothetical protein